MRPARYLVALGFVFCFGCATGDGPGIGPDADPNDPNAPDAATVPNEQADAAIPNGCTSATCDLFPQCGCAAGDACDLDGADLPGGATECRSVTVAGQEDANCNTVGGCGAGYVCLGSNGQCRKYCSTAADCRNNEFCLINVTYDSGGGNFMNVPGASTCTKACEPHLTSGNGCPSSPQFACRMFRDNPDGIADNGDEYFLTDCTTAGAGVLDADCTANSSADCAVGFTCVTIGGTTNQCKESCVVGAVPDTCTAGACTAFADPQPQVGTTTYGFCQ